MRSSISRPFCDLPDASDLIWDEVLKGLPEVEAEVVRMRFDLGSGQPLSATQMAADPHCASSPGVGLARSAQAMVLRKSTLCRIIEKSRLMH